MSQINDRLLERELLVLTVRETRLRKFENTIEYNREPDWATVRFGV